MPQKRLSKVIGILAVILILITGVFLAWWFLIRQPPVPHNIITLSGRIEGDDSVVAAKTSGRIRDIRVREGDAVKTGDIIAILDDEQAAAREQQAKSATQESDTRVTHAQQQIEVLNEQFRQARLTVDQAKLDAQGRVHQAEAQ